MTPLALSAILLAATLPRAAPATDSGARNVSVRLFSTLTSVTITPTGANPWNSRCPSCAHQPFTTPLHIHAATHLYAGGTLTITDDQTHATKSATGLWHLRSNGHNIDVILTLPSERYVAAVLNAETAPAEPTQSLQAMAIVARTYALNGTHYAPPPGHLAAPLCDSTQCQAMRLGPTTPAIEAAVRATSGETLWSGPHRAEVYFSQSCGGTTEDASTLTADHHTLPYLHPHADPFCLRQGPAAWHAELTLDELKQLAQLNHWPLPTDLVAARVTQRTASQRALRIAFVGRTGTSTSIPATDLRLAIGRSLGWNRVRSEAYDLALRNNTLVFDGHGHGHGVGLCQQGATEMAHQGRTDRDILAFYFPGTTLRIAPQDAGWLSTQLGPITLRTTRPLTPDDQSLFTHAWQQALQRFPSPHAPAPTVTIAPSTELFRQLTNQPGWMLASTSADNIVLQPTSLFRTHAANLSSTLLHEMLHVLVEREANPNTPLWLREGLVELQAELLPELQAELLSNQPTPAAPSRNTVSTDAALSHPTSHSSSQAAHIAAAVRVHKLVQHYGLSTVRSWLASGVPPAIE